MGQIASLEAIGGLVGGLVSVFAVVRSWGLIRDFVLGGPQ